MLFLHFYFKKFVFCMSVYEKTFAYSCLEHMQRFFLSLVSPFEGETLCLLYCAGCAGVCCAGVC